MSGDPDDPGAGSPRSPRASRASRDSSVVPGLPSGPRVSGLLPGVEAGRIDGHPYIRVGGDRSAGSRTDTGGGSGDRTGAPAGGGGDAATDRPPVVLVPGLNDPLCRVTEFLPYDAAVARFCRRIGGGRPTYAVSRPPELPADCAAVARQYESVLDRVCQRTGTDRVDLVGLSMGGFLAVELADGDRVRRTVLGLAADRLSPRGRRRLDRWTGLAAAGDWRSLRLAACDALSRGPRRRLFRGLARLYGRLPGTTPGPTRVADFRASVEATMAWTAGDRLAAVEGPTLVVGGDGDPFFSLAAFRRTARALPRGRLARLRGIGHQVALSAPSVLASVVSEFLAE